MIETIKKCDCCGAVEKEFDTEFGSIILKHPVNFDTYGYISASGINNSVYDLCPKCIEAIENFIANQSFIGANSTPEVKEDD